MNRERAKPEPVIRRRAVDRTGSRGTREPAVREVRGQKAAPEPVIRRRPADRTGGRRATESSAPEVRSQKAAPEPVIRRRPADRTGGRRATESSAPEVRGQKAAPEAVIRRRPADRTGGRRATESSAPEVRGQKAAPEAVIRRRPADRTGGRRATESSAPEVRGQKAVPEAVIRRRPVDRTGGRRATESSAPEVRGQKAAPEAVIRRRPADRTGGRRATESSAPEARGQKAASGRFRYKLTLEYDGTGYSGWQTQQNARSIQGTLIEAATELFGERVDIQGAGRTDAGVHALAQVAHLDAPKRMPPQRLLQGLNDLLPAPIHVLKVEEAAADFHARHMAKARSYVYLISRERTAFGKRYVWWVKDRLDLGRMEAAAALFCGFHDFASFADKRIDKNLSTAVKIDRAEVAAAGDLILFRIVGSHFLWKMVRRLAGILVEAGRGSLPAADVERLLTQASELPARCTAPPSGLFLAQVLYEGDRLSPLLPLPLPVRLREG